MKKLVPWAIAALALTGALHEASAAMQVGDYLSLSGFGTAGAVRTDSDEGQLGRDRQIGGADKKTSFEVDSNLGLQMTAKATAWLSGTVQVLAAKRDDTDNIAPRFEWAFVTVKPLDGLTLRGGRMAAPVFMISDSRNIGYANTWVRAPNEVYGLNPFTNFKGVDGTYRKTLGPVALSITGFGGTTSFPAAPNVEATGDRLRGVNLQLETAWANFRAGHVSTDVTIPLFGVSGSRYSFSGYGVSVDRDNIVAQAEYVKRHVNTNPQGTDATGWYVMGGYRFDALTPYAILSSTKPKYPGSPNLVSATQKSTALGLRWDALSSAAIKFQVDYIDTDNTQGISFTTPAAPPGPNVAPVTKPVTALSVTVDFTF